MDVSETDLPGVGKRYEVSLREGGVAVVIVHNTGRRELFYRENPDADSEELLDLTDPESRVIGSILEGAYFQPVSTDDAETLIGNNVVIDWYTIGSDDPVVGETLAEANIRERTGAAVVAVERGEECVTSPEADFEIHEGDVLVAIGTREDQAELEALFE